MIPDRYRRDATDVQAMQLCCPRDLHIADLWLRAHDREFRAATVHPALTERGLLVPTGPRTYQVARLGDWITHDLTTGRFAVADDDEFRAVHRTHTTEATA